MIMPGKNLGSDIQPRHHLTHIAIPHIRNIPAASSGHVVTERCLLEALAPTTDDAPAET